MGISQLYKAPFVEDKIYHIYNRTNNKEKLFRKDEDYLGFLHKLYKYTSSFLDFFSWNLIPNHFHICVRIKSFDCITGYLQSQDNQWLCKTETKFLAQEKTIHDLIDNAFQKFFISYSMSYNNSYNRKGNLIHRPFKHLFVDKEEQFTRTTVYIHANAIKHKLVEKIEDYRWSSYHSIISDKPTKLLRGELLDWFGGIDQFIKIHREHTQYYYENGISIEDR